MLAAVKYLNNSVWLLTGLVSEVSTQHPNQADRPNPFRVHESSQKGDVNASNGQRIVSRNLGDKTAM